MTDWQARTSLAIESKALSTLLRQHDPLEVLSKWTLVRGQLEERVWAQIDAILTEIAHRAMLGDDTEDATIGQGDAADPSESD